ncbi:hypothetical protein [Rhabdothermincola salaria]|uniref:hypothetical protein n=1 Tax=Rhabdothermincola salaria TaxID=2903142 RepID=UPI001E36E385|nr:hypothetical protein [Rhabdothermincola salaria]MCD9622713.1 hypothetical protein [Rhabdothermincola salaria]
MTDAESRPVRLTFPAEARNLRIARLTAAGVAGEAGFSLDAIEDLRVAVDELCAVLVDGAGPDADATVTYRVVGDQVVVEGECQNGAADADLHSVARELLKMTTDDYTVAKAGDRVSFRMVKQRHATSV